MTEPQLLFLLEKRGSLQQESRDELAVILSNDPPTRGAELSLAEELRHPSVENPGELRARLQTVAVKRAGSCRCAMPIPKWNKADLRKASACGRQQVLVAAKVDIPLGVSYLAVRMYEMARIYLYRYH